MRKVLVNEKNMAWVTCEKCSNTSSVDLSNLSKISGSIHIINYKCVGCATVFEVACEFRRVNRKEVSLNGSFIQQQPMEDYAGRIEIIDISKTGIKFKTRVKYNFKPGYILKLTFTLNDGRKTNVNQIIEVKWVSGQIIGGEFKNQDQRTKTDIGFYLMT
ncbi:PilZ domain-containing protein [Syntrophus gentianae]|uniref:PilZ domain-containing protein n=1 Tax=Syntrophus gentianae TaxID=43775 RepID=A0A1H7ZDY5_9BACT|nr:PilZ domain-containing protein [Syntrophus gentianae]SEM55738.1 PilZ domain-containing protein [Syntrophus gentianae]